MAVMNGRRCSPPIMDDGISLVIGCRNLFDEDPPVCFTCGAIGLSTVSHDLPGTQGYIRVTYENNGSKISMTILTAPSGAVFA